LYCCYCVFFFQAEDGIRDYKVTGVQTCALPISLQPMCTWAGLIAFDTTAHVHIGCSAGDTKQGIVADEQGRFDVPGLYNITLYPVARGPDHPARFFGRTDGKDRKSTRLNSSHLVISYPAFCFD